MARREISLRGRYWFSHSLSEGWYLPGTGSYRGQAGNVSEGGGSSGERGRRGAGGSQGLGGCSSPADQLEDPVTHD